MLPSRAGCAFKSVNLSFFYFDPSLFGSTRGDSLWCVNLSTKIIFCFSFLSGSSSYLILGGGNLRFSILAARAF